MVNFSLKVIIILLCFDDLVVGVLQVVFELSILLALGGQLALEIVDLSLNVVQVILGLLFVFLSSFKIILLLCKVTLRHDKVTIEIILLTFQLLDAVVQLADFFIGSIQFRLQLVDFFGSIFFLEHFDLQFQGLDLFFQLSVLFLFCIKQSVLITSETHEVLVATLDALHFVSYHNHLAL